MTHSHLTLSAILFTVCASVTYAGVAIEFNVDSVYAANGEFVPTTGIGLLIADTNGDGFGSLRTGGIETGNFVGSSDLIVYRADFSTVAMPGVWYERISLPLTDSWTAGSSLAFVWFPDLTVASLSIRSGDAYGMAIHPDWLTPNDGVSVVYQIISTTNQGVLSDDPMIVTLNVADNQLRASLSVVPEFSGFAVIAALVVLVPALARRRLR